MKKYLMMPLFALAIITNTQAMKKRTVIFRPEGKNIIPPGENPFNYLHSGLADKILSNLPPHDLAPCLTLNRQFHNLTQQILSNPYYLEAIKRDYPNLTTKNPYEVIKIIEALRFLKFTRKKQKAPNSSLTDLKDHLEKLLKTLIKEKNIYSGNQYFGYRVRPNFKYLIQLLKEAIKQNSSQTVAFLFTYQLDQAIPQVIYNHTAKKPTSQFHTAHPDHVLNYPHGSSDSPFLTALKNEPLEYKKKLVEKAINLGHSRIAQYLAKKLNVPVKSRKRPRDQQEELFIPAKRTCLWNPFTWW